MFQGRPIGLSLAALLTVSLVPAVTLAQDIDPSVMSQLLDPDKLFTSVIIIATTYIVSGLVGAGLENLGEKFSARRLLLKKVASLTRFGLYLTAAFVIVLGVLRPDQQTWLALSATLAVTIGFALKDLASSVIAGVIILMDSPFQVGDRAQFGDTYGEVMEIGLRTVKINTLDDNLVSIPNNKFLTDAVASANAGALDMMVVIDFHIGIDDDHDTAQKIVQEATVTSKYVFLRKPVGVHVNDVLLGQMTATRIRTKFYVSDTRYEVAIKTDITQRVKRAFSKAAIGSPYMQHEEKRRPSPN